MINRHDEGYVEKLKNKDISEFTEDEMLLWQYMLAHEYYGDAPEEEEKCSEN